MLNASYDFIILQILNNLMSTSPLSVYDNNNFLSENRPAEKIYVN